MSAGICIMNRNAIAMAADSAVTIGDHVAIHNSANKLFSLSKVAPVGAIIYASNSFMSVPFEIIIKEYKKNIGNKTFFYLKDYLSDFISYLESNYELFRFAINEDNYVKSVFENLMAGLIGDYKILLDSKKNNKGSELTNDEIDVVNKEAIKATIEFIDSLEDIDGASVSEYIKNKYFDCFVQYIKSNNNLSWIREEQINELTNQIFNIYNKKFDRNGYIGFAIAGYGEKEIYPSLVHIHLLGYINSKIRYYTIQESFINDDVPSSIIPFAQVDVMQTFLFGINDHLLGYLVNEIPKQIIQKLKNMDNALFALNKKEIVLQDLIGVTNDIIQNLNNTVLVNYMAPIFASIATLPIEELGLLAESMINITSVRRKVAMDKNIGTVGGPIDVSIISKGDGVIWLKRKHYFERKFNPQFFYSHYLRVRRK